jgi:superfamily II DNA or RNA helicase
MITLEYRTHLVIRGLGPDAADKLGCDLAKFKNPKYAASSRFAWNRKPAAGISEYLTIYTYDAETDTLTLPRGATPRVLTWLAGAGLKVAERRDLSALPDAADMPTGALTPRDYQATAANAAIGAGQGLIVAGTGTGKTVIGLLLAQLLKTPTLFIVHTSTLLDQTVERAREFLGVEPGVIGGGKWEPRQFTVAVVQTLSSRGVGDLADKFGLVILDEAHHCPAETFAAVVQQFSARFRFGLTATPRRADGLSPMLEAVIGPIVYRLEGNSLPLRYTRVDTGCLLEKIPERRSVARRTAKGNVTLILDGVEEEPKDVDFTALTTKLCADRKRTAFIADYIAEHHTASSLVLTDRVEHVTDLVAALTTRGLKAIGLSGADVTRAVRESVIGGVNGGAYEVLVSTPGMVGEGFDCPRLDTLFSAIATANPTRTEQCAGRVTRPYEGKDFGRVYDFVDDGILPLLNMWWARRRVYARLTGRS